MAIQYVGGQVGNRTNASSALSVNYALTGGLAAVPAAGDLVIVTVVAGSAGRNVAMAVTTPATWTALGQLNQSAQTNDTSMDVSRKFMTATPDTAVTIPGTTNNADGQAYAIQVWRGVDATTPMDTAAVSAGTTGTARCDPAAITPVTVGAVIVICGGGAAGTGAAYTAPANYTTNFLTDNGADTTDGMVGMGYRATTWTSGAENPAAFTGGAANAADSWCSYTLALRPAAAPNHATTGALTGQGSTTAGTAVHRPKHTTTGALTGPGATVAGSAAHVARHTTSGVLAGQGSTTAGSAARTRQHATTGILAGQGSVTAGSAARTRVHPASGVLAGSGAAVSGTAVHRALHATAGVLAGSGAAMAGDAARSLGATAHDASGALAGAGSVVAGSAARTRAHATTGAIPGLAAQLIAEAQRDDPAGPVSHDASGALVGGGAQIVGSALNGRILGAGRGGSSSGAGPARPANVQSGGRSSALSGSRSNTQTGKR